MSTTAAQLSENSHQGLDCLKAALFLASTDANSNTAFEMPPCLWQNDIRPRCSGKERDNETGLDYFGARYYSGAQGRFTSPDPMLNSGRPWDPRSWNRYSYVRNNPLVYTDPTGLYDLDNTCSASNKKCNENFRKSADDLKKGLKNLQKQLKDVKDPTQKARLETALKAMGTENDHNNVLVSFGKTNGGGAAETLPTYNAQTGKVGFNVTFDPSMMGNQNDYAVAGAHEGTHVDDLGNPMFNNPATTLSDFSLEYRGYQTTVFAASALGESSRTANYDGKKFVLWNGSWADVDKNITGYIKEFHDNKGNKTHPETTPHNPWKN
jgi:RHS repeat-associated protein